MLLLRTGFVASTGVPPTRKGKWVTDTVTSRPFRPCAAPAHGWRDVT